MHGDVSIQLHVPFYQEHKILNSKKIPLTQKSNLIPYIPKFLSCTQENTKTRRHEKLSLHKVFHRNKMSEVKYN